MSKKQKNEIKAAEIFARKGNPPQDVFSWLHQTKYGTLSTINVREETAGFPLGSIVPFAIDRKGRPFIFIANIAAHTHNLSSNNKASLFIHNGQAQGDPQKTWRASILGSFSKIVSNTDEKIDPYCEQVSQEEINELMARYIERVPKAKGYAQTHGFHFWRLNDIKSIRYIAGFGRICWIQGDEYSDAVEREDLLSMRKGAMQHMNDDHQHNMLEICKKFHHIEDEQVQMISLDNHGCLFQAQPSNEMYYSSFLNVVQSPADFKKEIISLLGKARKQSANTSSS